MIGQRSDYFIIVDEFLSTVKLKNIRKIEIRGKTRLEYSLTVSY